MIQLAHYNKQVGSHFCFCAAETSSDSTVDRLKGQLWTLWHAILQPEILLPAAFIFLWQVMAIH